MTSGNGHPMVDRLVELRFQRKAAQGVAGYLEAKVAEWENLMIQSGIPLPPETGTGQTPAAAGNAEDPGGNPATEVQGACDGGPGEDEARNGEENGGADQPAAAGEAKIARSRLEELRLIPEMKQPEGLRREKKLLERIAAWGRQAAMLKVIAEESNNRFMLTDAAILISSAGQSPVPVKALAIQLRSNIVRKNPEHWKIHDEDGARYDVEYFPNDDALTAGKEKSDSEPAQAPPGNGQNRMATMLPLDNGEQG